MAVSEDKKRVSVTVPKELLRRIEAEAEGAELSRSEYMLLLIELYYKNVNGRNSERNELLPN